ncbi:sigma 54-interacting transcriptional regulator [Nitrospira sp. M1]
MSSFTPEDETSGTAEQLQETLHHLGERVKELSALHSTARLFQEDGGSTEELLAKMVALLPASWQYPEITAARIRFGEVEIATPNYQATPWVQHADFVCQGDIFGSLEVVYLEERPLEVEGPFLAEERNLIDSLAEMLTIHLDRKRSSDALRGLSKVYRDATDPIILEDLAGVVTSVNPEAERAYGWNAAELIGQPITVLVPPEEHPQVQGQRMRCQQGQVVRNVSGVRQSKDGKRLPVLITLSLLTDEEGQPTGIATFAKDISVLKETEAALRNAHDELEARVKERTSELHQANDLLTEEIAQRTEIESRLEQVIGKLQRSHDDLQAMMNQLSIGVALTDRSGTILFLNRAAQQLCQKRSEQCVGKQWKELFGDAESLARLEEIVQQSPQKRESMLVKMPNVPGGRISWANVDICDDPRDSQQKIFYLYDTSEVENLRRLLGESGKFQDLIGKSQGMQAVFQQIHELARVDSTVLIEGETGTGKELVARAIHRTSHRKDMPFVAVNCAGLTESLVASQLFGHKRGAFTGAVSDQTGLFEAAEGGTLFLDEIGDIPLSIQTSLLRVLQEREVTRLGESKLRKINVRVIAATHHHLADDVEAGEFRADLLYRIRVGRVLLPPLRERREDIPLLSSFFLGQCQATTGRPVNQISHEAVRLLVSHDWPGNVRELQHAIEFGVIRSRGPILQPHDFPPEVLDQQDVPPRLARGKNAPIEDQGDPILSALEKTGGNRSAAAKLLGISRVTLYRRLSRLGIK